MTAIYSYCSGDEIIMIADNLNSNQPENPVQKISKVNNRFLVGVIGADCPNLALMTLENAKLTYDFKDMSCLADFLARVSRNFARYLYPMYYCNLKEFKEKGEDVNLASFFEQTSSLVIIDTKEKTIAQFDLGKPFCKEGYTEQPYCRYLVQENINFHSYAAVEEGMYSRRVTEDEEKDLSGFIVSHLKRTHKKFSKHVGSIGSSFVSDSGQTTESLLNIIDGQFASTDFELLDYFISKGKTEGEQTVEGPSSEFWEGERGED